MMQFPFTADTPPEHDGPLPARADVVVIGGGIAGVMTAFYLARRGLSVTLCEKGRVAAEQSSRNWGWVRQQGRHPAELPVMVEARRLWQGLARETGEDLGLAETGVTFLARTEAELARLETWLPHARAHGVDSRMVSAAELAALLPGAGRHWLGGLHTASDMRAEPWRAVPALARAAAREGVTIREHCAVRLLDIATGRVAGVVTEKGRIACDQVVLAGGAWSALFARRHGVNLPQLSVRATVGATEAMPEALPGAAIEMADGFAVRRRQDGGYTLAPGLLHELYVGPDAFRHFRKYIPQMRGGHGGTKLRALVPRGYPDGWTTPRRWAADRPSPFEAMRVLNPAPNMAALDGVATRFAEVFPDLGRPRWAKCWAGMIDVMPDELPVIDEAPEVPGLVIATGLSGHGFGIGPGVGRVVADFLLGGQMGHDLLPFRLSRFTDGSPISMGESL